MSRASSQEGIPILGWCRGNYVAKGTELTTGCNGHVVYFAGNRRKRRD